MFRLFELVELVDLDLSYNSLHCLSRDVAKLRYYNQYTCIQSCIYIDINRGILYNNGLIWESIGPIIPSQK